MLLIEIQSDSFYWIWCTVCLYENPMGIFSCMIHTVWIGKGWKLVWNIIMSVFIKPTEWYGMR